jgi:soluble lytic murein transglycosylase-like protein
MILRRAVAALALGVLAAGVVPAQAEVWGYVDAQGMAHFAPHKLDARYELFFAGEGSFDTAAGTTPRAVAVPTSSKSKLLAYFEISPRFRQVKHHLRDAAREHDLDFELLQALIATESGFDPLAVSPKGAVGLMQVMPATAERYGVVGDGKATVASKLTDPRTNLRAGARYLSALMRMFPGQLDLVLAAYNAGEGAVQRAGNRIPNYRETQNYVKTVMQLYGMLKPPATVAAGRSLRRVQMQLPGAAADLED